MRLEGIRRNSRVVLGEVLHSEATFLAESRFMEAFEVYTARDLRDRSGQLLKHAADGSIGVITQHGKPSVLAIPFDAHLLQHGIHRVLGLYMVRTRQLTLAQAAKLADMDLSSFIELLGASGIDAVDYPAEDLSGDMGNALAACRHR